MSRLSMMVFAGLVAIGGMSQAQAQNWPEPIYVIVSLADADNPDVKGFHLADLKIADAELVVE